MPKLGALLVGLVLFLSACKHNAPVVDGSVSAGGTIHCASEAVKRNWSRVYPEVMGCLVGIIETPMACLDAIAPAVKVGIEVVACIVRDAGKQAAMQSKQNESDTASLRKAERASAWLETRKFQFADQR